jgi:hypothetical protein
MALIEVTDLDIESEIFNYAPPSNPQNNLLGQAHFLISRIEMRRGAAVRRAVAQIIAIQQIQCHFPHTCLPDP